MTVELLGAPSLGKVDMRALYNLYIVDNTEVRLNI